MGCTQSKRSKNPPLTHKTYHNTSDRGTNSDQEKSRLIPFPKTVRPSDHGRGSLGSQDLHPLPSSSQHGRNRAHHRGSDPQGLSRQHGSSYDHPSRNQHTSHHSNGNSRQDDGRRDHRSTHRQGNSHQYDPRGAPSHGRRGSGSGTGGGRGSVRDTAISSSRAHDYAGQYQRHHQRLEPIDEMPRYYERQSRRQSSRYY